MMQVMAHPARFAGADGGTGPGADDGCGCMAPGRSRC